MGNGVGSARGLFRWGQLCTDAAPLGLWYIVRSSLLYTCRPSRAKKLIRVLWEFAIAGFTIAFAIHSFDLA